MSLTHLEGGGWTIADLSRLAVHEIDEHTGLVLHTALTEADPDLTPDSELLTAAVASGVLVETGSPTAPTPTNADNADNPDNADKDTQP